MEKTYSSIPKKTLQVLRGESPRERILHRLHAVVLVMSGHSALQVGKIFGDSPRAVAYWVTRFKAQGMRGLEEEARPGRPAKVSAAQVKKLQTFMRLSAAKAKPVTAKMLSDYLSEEFAITLTPRQCWRILKKLKS